MTPSRARRAFAAAGLVALAAGPAAAHDFWIEPESFRPAAEQILRVRLRVGTSFAGDEVARSDEHVLSFAAHGPTAVLAIAGRDGQMPAGLVRPVEPGLYVLGYESRSKFLELQPEKFAAYLREEGLEAILDERARLGEAERPSRELYARCAKSLVRVGDGPTSGFDRRLGFALELVPLTDPFAPPATGARAFLLLHEGKPLEGALVVALRREAPQHPISARTDRDGRAELALDRGGAWLVKAVHMVRSSAPERAEWQSRWASLTFELPLAVEPSTGR